MSNELAVVQTNSVTREELLDYIRLNQMTISSERKELLLKVCELNGLNPFKKEVYFTPFYNSKSQQMDVELVTAYQVYLQRAELSGHLDGWEVSSELDDKGIPIRATVTIYRNDWTHPFVHSVLFSEFAKYGKDGKLSSTWEKMSDFMLRKVAIAQGFRMAFPFELGAIPYTQEEMADIESRQPPIATQQPPVMPRQEKQEQIKPSQDDINANNILLESIANIESIKYIAEKYIGNITEFTENDFTKKIKPDLIEFVNNQRKTGIFKDVDKITWADKKKEFGGLDKTATCGDYIGFIGSLL
jgi:phage recombination protein Bet